MKNQTLKFLLTLPLLFLIQACGGDDGGNEFLQALENPTPEFSVFWASCDNTASTTEVVGGDDDDDDDEASTASGKTCREWYGEFFSTINLQQACKSVKDGVLSESYCAKEGLLGLCSVPIGIESETRYYYYEKDWGLLAASKDCNNKDPSAQWLDLSSKTE